MTRKIPLHPGLILDDVITDVNKLSIKDASHALGITRQSLSRIVNGHTDISPLMAMRIAHVFGGTPDIWIRLQAKHDLAQVQKKFSTKGLSVVYREDPQAMPA